ncbi:AAA family ATPase [Mucilaginibacter sp. X5P1]|uniref:AAA family ATPase n=1 Tax=Mucilaginibacter sp. X5P1 TaxID=2723088 RepID=UPI00160AA0AA|nr:AAA family ATPase [Mucilaginibacter sp. X5P1]MBB6141242.1 hypothetical protein [Mucilaginibacter sp. X5P1]
MNPKTTSHRPPIIQELREMSRPPLTPEISEYLNPTQGIEGAFIIKKAGAWLKTATKQPEARMLFDRFWFEGELCILFADTNIGKSILAVQIGDSISRGQPIGGLQLTASAAPVLYFDFELSHKQFHTRYTAPGHGNYNFNKHFSRAVFNPAANKMHKFSSYQAYIENEIENAILTAKAKVLIIDNITCLRFDTHATNGALNLVRSLQTIKNKYHISIMVLAHTPKRNPIKPVTRNDLQGSKMLINFCDSAFAIGESQSVNGLRYLKQIKQRSIHQEYGAEKVCLCTIIKPQNFLQFHFSGHSPESEHLMPYTEQYRKNTETRVAQLQSQNLSIRQIAAKLNIASSTVFRIVRRLEKKEMNEPPTKSSPLERGQGCVSQRNGHAEALEA